GPAQRSGGDRFGAVLDAFDKAPAYGRGNRQDHDAYLKFPGSLLRHGPTTIAKRICRMTLFYSGSPASTRCSPSSRGCSASLNPSPAANLAAPMPGVPPTLGP